MFVRRRPLMRAAMVGGAGYYAGRRMKQNRESEAEQEARLAGLESQQAYAAPAAAPAAQPAGLSSSSIDQLKQLAELKTQGVLKEDELQAQKQRILGAS